jgi:hypothetical protein
MVHKKGRMTVIWQHRMSGVSLEQERSETSTREFNRYNIIIAAIQETRRQSSEIFDTGDYMACYSGSNKHNRFGTGFMIHKRVEDNMLNFEPVDERIHYLRLKGKFFNITLICVHVPTEDNYDIVKSSFCDRLDRVYHTTPKHDAAMVTGDMNIKVSNEPLTP